MVETSVPHHWWNTLDFHRWWELQAHLPNDLARIGASG